MSDPRCSHILVFGDLGATAEDETPTKVCGKPATWRAAQPGVRWRYRCDEHIAEFQALRRTLPMLIIEAVREQP